MKFDVKFFYKILFVLVLFILFDFCCPIKQLFHTPCPTCGMSSAWLQAFKLNFDYAYQIHRYYYLGPVIVFLVCWDTKSKVKDVLLIIISFILVLNYIGISLT